MNWFATMEISESERVWEALVSALMHSVWQAGIAAVLVALLLRGISARQANARAIVCGAFQMLVLLSFLVTWAYLSVSEVPQRDLVAGIGPRASADAVSVPGNLAASPYPDKSFVTSGHHRQTALKDPMGGSVSTELNNVPPDWQRWIGWAWVGGVMLMLLRMIRDLREGTSAVRGGRAGDAALLEAVRSVAERVGVARRFRVVISDRVSGPAVFGILRPVLLLPAVPLGLPPEQLEAVLAHELAHVKRHDWAWHFVSRMVEAVLFFNPAVWWLGRMACREREAAADALAVRFTHAPDALARALVAWGEGAQQAPRVSVAWRGEEGGLRERVLRIVRPEYRPSVRFSPVGLSAALGIALVMSAGVWRGAEQAVVVAQEILSPAERISRIEEAAQTVAKRSAETAVIKSMTWTGRVRTSDGVPLGETSPHGSGVVATVQESKNP